MSLIDFWLFSMEFTEFHLANYLCKGILKTKKKSKKFLFKKKSESKKFAKISIVKLLIFNCSNDSLRTCWTDWIWNSAQLWAYTKSVEFFFNFKLHEIHISIISANRLPRVYSLSWKSLLSSIWIKQVECVCFAYS